MGNSKRKTKKVKKKVKTKKKKNFFGDTITPIDDGKSEYVLI